MSRVFSPVYQMGEYNYFTCLNAALDMLDAQFYNEITTPICGKTLRGHFSKHLTLVSGVGVGRLSNFKDRGHRKEWLVQFSYN